MGGGGGGGIKKEKKYFFKKQKFGIGKRRLFSLTTSAW